MASSIDWISYLPKTEGNLAYWQLLVAATAVFNTIQNFASLKLTRKIYNVNPANVTPLSARTFGAWTLTSAVVRGYAAYNIHSKIVYDMAMFTYLVAFAHFFSEWLIFRSAKLNAGLLSPILVSTLSLFWMYNEYEFYIRT